MIGPMGVELALRTGRQHFASLDISSTHQSWCLAVERIIARETHAQATLIAWKCKAMLKAGNPGVFDAEALLYPLIAERLQE